MAQKKVQRDRGDGATIDLNGFRCISNQLSRAANQNQHYKKIQRSAFVKIRYILPSVVVRSCDFVVCLRYNRSFELSLRRQHMNYIFDKLK